jgi:hypothetical protein
MQSSKPNSDKMEGEDEDVCCGNRITFSPPPCPHLQQIRLSVLQNYHTVQRYLLATKLKLVDHQMVCFFVEIER